MKVHLIRKQTFIVCLILIIGSGCVAELSKIFPLTPTPIPTSKPTATLKPSATPLPDNMGSEFPTGVFQPVSELTSVTDVNTVEFTEDGAFNWDGKGWRVGGKYGVNGNLYTEMTFVYPTGRQVPATYYWYFDGIKLTFQLWGVDLRPHRKSVYQGIEYILISKSEPSSGEEEIQFPAGKFFLDSSNYYAIEFDENGTWYDYRTEGASPAGQGKFVINGNLYTEMTHNYQDAFQVPATYYWTYDGKNLTFELWGEDVNSDRQALFDGQTYITAD